MAIVLLLWLKNGEGWMTLRSIGGALANMKVVAWPESFSDTSESEENEEEICVSGSF